MKSPRIADLPAPPAGKHGWPWTVETVPTQADGAEVELCPRITIVTPSLNQVSYIEETIRSVLLQGYADLEYLIVDGGSADGTVEIIRKYSPWLAHWVSERDHGQSDAINKGIGRGTGDICGWLCSDDVLAPGALNTVGEFFRDTPNCRWLAGEIDTLFIESGETIQTCPDIENASDLIEFWKYGRARLDRDGLLRVHGIAQPATYWARSLWREAGGVRPDLHYAMDYDLWMRFAARAALFTVARKMATARMYPMCKTMAHGQKQYEEVLAVACAAADRRGISRLHLSARYWRWQAEVRWHRMSDQVGRRRWRGVAGALLRLVLDPQRVIQQHMLMERLVRQWRRKQPA